jgi:hypothetical protein
MIRIKKASEIFQNRISTKYMEEFMKYTEKSICGFEEDSPYYGPMWQKTAIV